MTSVLSATCSSSGTPASTIDIDEDEGDDVVYCMGAVSQVRQPCNLEIGCHFFDFSVVELLCSRDTSSSNTRLAVYRRFHISCIRMSLHVLFRLERNFRSMSRMTHCIWPTSSRAQPTIASY